MLLIVQAEHATTPSTTSSSLKSFATPGFSEPKSASTLINLATPLAPSNSSSLSQTGLKRLSPIESSSACEARPGVKKAKVVQRQAEKENHPSPSKSGSQRRRIEGTPSRPKLPSLLEKATGKRAETPIVLDDEDCFAPPPSVSSNVR